MSMSISRGGVRAALGAALGLVVVSGLLGCAGRSTIAAGSAPAPGRLEVVASNARQWTGVAVSASGRMFVNFPRWFGPHELSVAEVMPDGTLRAFPDDTWQRWDPLRKSLPVGQWVCVQSVHVDDRDRLWVLDPAAPKFEGPVPGGAKLVEFDLFTGRPLRVYTFDDRIAPKGSYLNDVRVDRGTGHAYMTDSGLGAIVVLDLASGMSRRLLADHPSTKAEEITPIVGGKELRFADGTVPRIHSDGIALDAKGGWLYWQALTGTTLYRIKTSVLRDESLGADAVAAAVERVGDSVMTDGMEFDPATGNIFFTALEQDAVVYRVPGGEYKTLVKDRELAWPDSLAVGAADASGRRSIFVTRAQIHLGPPVAKEMPTSAYRVYRAALPAE